MKELPTIETERLLLRTFELSDTKDVQRLAGDRSIADTTLNIPHPYENGMAEEWMSLRSVFLITNIGRIPYSILDVQCSMFEVHSFLSRLNWPFFQASGYAHMGRCSLSPPAANE